MADPLSNLPFIFGGGPGSGTLTYEQLQARRKIALALAARQRKFPTTIGEGLTYAGEKFAEAIEDRRLDAAEQASKAENDKRRQELFGGGAVTGTAPVTPPVASSSIEPPVPPDVNVASLDPGVATTNPDTAAVAKLQAAVVPPPAQPPAPRAMRPPVQVPPQIQAEMTRAFDERGVPQDMRENYYNTLAQRESRFNPNAVSSTGAKGIFQFVPGTARQYGLTGNERDPYRNTLAAIDLTNDNRNAMARALAREPTYADLALGHNQGAITAANMISGRGNASARNLAVNGVPAGMGSQDAAAFLQRKLGFDPRQQVAASMMAQQQPDQPQIADEIVPSPTRVASLAPGMGLGGVSDAPPTASARPGAPPSPLQGAAPPVASPIMPAPPVPTPNQRLAQAVQQQSMPVAQPQPVDPGPEPSLRGMIESNPSLRQQMDTARRIASDPVASPSLQADAQRRYIELEKRANDAYTKQWTIWHERTKVKEAWDLAAEERQRARDTHQQKIPQQPAPAPSSPMTGPDPRLNTPESPQRSRIPTPAPLPPGQPPDKWAEEQRPLMAKALEAVDKATPLFDDALNVIQKARVHPGREWGIGATGDIAQKLPWTEAAGFGLIVNQLKGKNFLAGYQQLRGAGNISEIEGVKTEQAQARVSTAQTKKDFDDALNDLEKSMRRDLELAQRKVNAPVTAWRAPGDNSSFAPDIGTIRGDNEYIGGNPNDPSSWKRIR